MKRDNRANYIVVLIIVTVYTVFNSRNYCQWWRR